LTVWQPESVRRQFFTFMAVSAVALAGCGASQGSSSNTTLGPVIVTTTVFAPSTDEAGPQVTETGPYDLMKAAASGITTPATTVNSPPETVVPPLAYSLIQDGVLAVQATCVDNFLIEHDSAGNLADVTSAAQDQDYQPAIAVYEQLERQQHQSNVCFEKR
jgi:hypothetical protein